MARSGLDFINPLDCPQIQRIGGQAVEGIGRHAKHMPGAYLFGRVADEGGFRVLRIDLYDFSANQGILP